LDCPDSNDLPPLSFPIYGRDQTAVDAEIESELQRILQLPLASKRPWDVTIRHVADALREIKRREKKRARRAHLKWERRLRERIHTRQDLIDYEQGRLARRMARQHGRRLLHQTAGTLPLYQRLQQRSTTLITAMEGPETLSIADKFATAWAPLLTVSHATETDHARGDQLRRLFTAPVQHTLSDKANAALMATITSKEVEETIKDHGAHKAGGADRLNNDFYRGWGSLLAETLAREFNHILEGAHATVVS
jgi:hypothetical protein